MDHSVLQPILDSPQLPMFIKKLNEEWEAEQKKRHAFWKDADEGVKSEFIGGEIVYHSPIYGRHWKAATRIYKHLIPFVYDNQLGEVGTEKVMIRMTRNDYEPDICFWSKEKSDTFGDKQSAFPPPDFIVEILSDSTQHRDRGIKFIDYALHGVAEYWIVDAENESVEQYLLHDQEYQLEVKIQNGIIESKAIPGFSMKVKEIFE